MFAFPHLGADSLQWEFNKDLVPRKITVQVEGQKKILDIRPNGFYKDGFIAEIMMTIRDITEKESLAKEIALRQQEESRRARVLHEFEYYQKVTKEVFSISTDKEKVEEAIFTKIDNINIEILKKAI